MKLNIILLIAAIGLLFVMVGERAEALDAYVEELGTFDGTTWNDRHIGTEAGSVPAASGALTSVNQNDKPTVYYFGLDKKVHQLWWTGSQWNYNGFGGGYGHSAYSLSGITSTKLGSDPRVYYIGDDLYVSEWSFNPSTGWGYNEIGLPHVSNGIGIASTPVYVLGQGTNPAVYYFGQSDNRPKQLHWDGTTWLFLDIAYEAHAPADSSSCEEITALTLNDPSSTSVTDPNVFYVGSSDHMVRQLGFGNGDWWYHAIGTASGAPQALPYASMASTTLISGGNPRVYYIDTNHNIVELGSNDNLNWAHTDCGVLAGAPPVSAVNHPGLAAITVGGQPHIYYIAQDQMVHEIYFDGTWHHRAIGAMAGASPSQIGGGLTATTYGGNPRVYYLGLPMPSNADHVGVYRPSIHMFYLDNGNRVSGGGDLSANFGLSSDLPVAGDWNGNGKAEIGVFRPSTHTFYLDYNGNRAWGAGDVSANFGLTNDLPVAGDWNGDNKDEIGVFRPSTHMFYLDYNGNRAWGTGDVSANFGLSTDLPTAGDWNNNGKDEIGVLRNGVWYQDWNGNRVWDAGDAKFSFGLTGDLPAAADWNGNGVDEAGIYRPSTHTFYLDYNGNRAWGSGDMTANFGLNGDKPVAGRWS